MSPRTRIRHVYRRADRTEEAAAREQLRLLREMRRRLLGAMAEASGFRLFHINQVLAAIDAEIARGRSAAQRAAANAIDEVFQAGHDLVGAVVGAPETLAGISSDLLQAAIEVTTDQVRAVWNELGARLKSAIRRVTLGITDPFAAVQEVARVLRDLKTFRTAEARAEAIVRTETNRTFSIATARRVQQAAEAGVRVKKAWLHAGDNRVRPAHLAAGQTYDTGGAIPINKPFIVDGEELMFPLDPRGSAENTINCRCRLLPVVA